MPLFPRFMSLFTWGSSANEALGYICSHTCAHVDTPRRVEHLVDSEFVQVTTGTSNTWSKTSCGQVVVFGKSYGLSPSVMGETKIVWHHLHASSTSPYALAVESGSSRVFWLSPEGVIPVVHAGRIVVGSSIACRDFQYGLIVDAATCSVVEIGQSAPLLRPSHMSLISPASHVYISEQYGAASSLTSGEIRIWDHACAAIDKPARILVKARSVTEPGPEWMERTDGHFVKRVSHFSLPNKCGGFGYAVESLRPHILVRFSLCVSNQPVSTIIGEPIIGMHDRLAIVSVSQNDAFVYIVDSVGNLYEIPHLINMDGNLGQYKILEQVRQVAVSNHHCAAIVSVRNFRRPINLSSTPSLQRACAESIMESRVTVENVSRVLFALVSRAVVDLDYLFDYAYSLFASNRDLIKYIAKDDFNHLGDIGEFVRAEKKVRFGSISFSEALILTRAEQVSEEPVAVESPPKHRSNRKDKKRELGGSHPCVAHASCSCVVGDSQETTDNDAQFVDETFVPLGIALQSSGREKGENFRVKKWTKCGNIFREPSLVSPVIAPWSSPTTSPTMTLPDLSWADSRKSRGSTSSRWFREDHVGDPKTVADAMREAIEDREVTEALRLVAEFEMRERNRAKKNRKRFAEFNSIIVRH
jgi:hypothetical protein